MAEHWVVMAGWIAALTHDILDRLRGWPVDLRDPSVGQRKCVQQFARRIALRCLLLAGRLLATGFVAGRLWPLWVGLLSVVGRGAVRPFRTVRPCVPASGVPAALRCTVSPGVDSGRVVLSRRRLAPTAAVGVAEAVAVAVAGAAALHSVRP